MTGVQSLVSVSILCATVDEAARVNNQNPWTITLLFVFHPFFCPCRSPELDFRIYFPLEKTKKDLCTDTCLFKRSRAPDVTRRPNSLASRPEDRLASSPPTDHTHVAHTTQVCTHNADDLFPSLSTKKINLFNLFLTQCSVSGLMRRLDIQLGPDLVVIKSDLTLSFVLYNSHVCSKFSKTLSFWVWLFVLQEDIITVTCVRGRFSNI